MAAAGGDGGGSHKDCSRLEEEEEWDDTTSLLGVKAKPVRRRRRPPCCVLASLGAAAVIAVLGAARSDAWYGGDLWKVMRLASAATGRGHRRGSFLVIGDWGWDPKFHGNVATGECQKAIADKMSEMMVGLGDVKFVINVGDSFYPVGVANKSDEQWDKKWRSVYPENVRSVPWYSVYGNRDLQLDPCSCSEDIEVCALVNEDVDNLSYFYMPAPSWAREHPELDLEVIGLDLNHFMLGWNRGLLPEAVFAEDCQHTKCPGACEGIMKRRADGAFRLFFERLQRSRAKNLLVFSHYPTDYFATQPRFLAGLSNASKHHIEYFGGHRNNVDQNSTASTRPNNNWLVGGGGGWACENYVPKQQGFVVGEIAADATITTYPALVDFSLCCP